jgi:hypothetical protein
MLFHIASMAALPFTMLEPGGNAVAPAGACKGFRRNKRRDNRRARSADGYRTDYPIGGKVDLEERLI